MTLLAAVAASGSGATSWLRGFLALSAILHGAHLTAREAARPRRRFVLPGGDGTPQIDGRLLADLRLSRRGPLTVLAWRESGGRWQHRCFWPDTLSRKARRELTLAAGDWRVSPTRRSMAP